MIHLIWAFMAMIGIVYAMINDNLDAVNEAIFSSAQDSVTLTITLMSMLVFWLGMMRIAKEAKLLDCLAKLLKPLAIRLFPEVPPEDPAVGYILSNITANLFGLGNAATPIGIKAMEEMKRLSGTTEASRSMITFLALNTSGLTLIPTTVIAIRMQYHSLSPTEIVGTTLIATVISTVSAIILDRMFYHLDERKNNKRK